MSRRVISLRGAAASAFMNAAMAKSEAPLDETSTYEAIAVYITLCTKTGAKRDMADAVACLKRLHLSGPNAALTGSDKKTQVRHLPACKAHDTDDDDWWECVPGCPKPPRPNSRDRKST